MKGELYDTAKMIHAEEDKFLRTLNSGESLLKKML